MHHFLKQECPVFSCTMWFTMMSVSYHFTSSTTPLYLKHSASKHTNFSPPSCTTSASRSL